MRRAALSVLLGLCLALLQPQRAVLAAASDQFFVRACLDDLTAVGDENQVGMDDRREAVRNRQGRAAVHERVQRRLQ